MRLLSESGIYSRVASDQSYMVYCKYPDVRIASVELAKACRMQLYTVYVEIFAVDLIFTGPCSNHDIKNRENFIQQSSPHQSQATSMLPYTWKSLIMLSVVCASMMIGYGTAVYYVCASWIRRFAN